MYMYQVLATRLFSRASNEPFIMVFRNFQRQRFILGSMYVLHLCAYTDTCGQLKRCFFNQVSRQCTSIFGKVYYYAFESTSFRYDLNDLLGILKSNKGCHVYVCRYISSRPTHVCIRIKDQLST